ncbi:hypothetical protein DFH28DRAFT_1128813 [Melampsora americana]|nr:hypothetical protein DFH28DRAFT_1128813 [Melampsora americana]
MTRNSTRKKVPVSFEGAVKKEGEEEQREVVTGHLVKGAWAPKTLKGYSSAVQKFKSYIESTGREFNNDEPMKTEDVYGFIVWAGPSKVEKGTGPGKELKSKTIAKYLAGLRAWHMTKHHEEPNLDKQMVDWLLKSTERSEEKKVLTRDKETDVEKKPITVMRLFDMVSSLNNKSDKHNLAIVVALVAFWGMMRLGEVLRETVEEGGLKVGDLTFETGKKGKIAVLRVWRAKTAKPETAQIATRTAISPRPGRSVSKTVSKRTREEENRRLTVFDKRERKEGPTDKNKIHETDGGGLGIWRRQRRRMVGPFV